MLGPHFAVMASPSGQLLLGVESALPANIRCITLREHFRTISIFTRRGGPIVENPASALLLGLAEVLLDYFI